MQDRITLLSIRLDQITLKVTPDMSDFRLYFNSNAYFPTFNNFFKTERMSLAPGNIFVCEHVNIDKVIDK